MFLFEFVEAADAGADDDATAVEVGSVEIEAAVVDGVDGGGKGIFPWEPAWITSGLKDSWGTGSAWDCNTFFDFYGSTLKGIRFMSDQYKFNE